jgi:hypothetical protein
MCVPGENTVIVNDCIVEYNCTTAFLIYITKYLTSFESENVLVVIVKPAHVRKEKMIIENNFFCNFAT